MGCSVLQTWISPPRTVVAAATCTLYESLAVTSTSPVRLVPFVLRKAASGASLSVTLPTMMLSTAKVPEHTVWVLCYSRGHHDSGAVPLFTYRWRCGATFQKRSRLMPDRGTCRAQIQEVRKPAVHMPSLWKAKTDVTVVSIVCVIFLGLGKIKRMIHLYLIVSCWCQTININLQKSIYFTAVTSGNHTQRFCHGPASYEIHKNPHGCFHTLRQVHNSHTYTRDEVWHAVVPHRVLG